MTVVRSLVRIVVGCSLIALLPQTLRAQDSDIPVELDETETYGVGARSVAMGLAQQGVAFDPTALTGNPASLAFLPDIHLNGGFSIRSILMALERGSRDENSLSRIAFDHVTVSLPAASDITVAFGNAMIHDPSRKLPYLGVLTREAGQEEVDAQDVDVAVRVWSFGFGWAATPRFALGGRFELLHGYRDETFIVAHGQTAEGPEADEFGLCYSCGNSETSFREDIRRNLDASGYRGAVSGFGFIGNHLSVGATLDFPSSLEYSGPVFIRYEDFLGPFEDEHVLIVDTITFPLRLGFGAAWEKDAITLAADGRFSDWEQIDFEGEILGPGRVPAYRSTFDFHLGAEYRLKTHPLALRGGLLFTPLPYRFLAGDTHLVFDENDPDDPGDDTSFVARDYPPAAITTDRWAFSFGTGIQITEQFSLDAAFQRSTWKREAEDGSTKESRRSNRFILDAGYRW